jgi:outer membrane protein TolC
VGARELTPRLVVSGSAGYANPALGKDTGFYAAGAAVIFPLTSFVGERARQEAQAQGAEAQADAADARRQQIDLQVASLRATLSGIIASLPATDASEKAAGAALDALDTRVKVGTVRAVEIEAARSLVVETQSAAAVLRVRARALQAKLALLGT